MIQFCLANVFVFQKQFCSPASTLHTKEFLPPITLLERLALLDKPLVFRAVIHLLEIQIKYEILSLHSFLPSSIPKSYYYAIGNYWTSMKYIHSATSLFVNKIFPIHVQSYFNLNTRSIVSLNFDNVFSIIHNGHFLNSMFTIIDPWNQERKPKSFPDVLPTRYMIVLFVALIGISAGSSFAVNYTSKQ